VLVVVVVGRTLLLALVVQGVAEQGEHLLVQYLELLEPLTPVAVAVAMVTAQQAAVVVLVSLFFLFQLQTILEQPQVHQRSQQAVQIQF
jgi:hypothetical protein